MPSKTDLWFNIAKPNSRSKIRLFCFPYAGGSASVFSDWAAHLGKDIEVLGVQPPGRGNRFVEAPITSLSEMVAELVEAIKPLLDKPFVFFGHSNGALISFELARALDAHGLISGLEHFVISANPAPQIRTFEPVLHNLPDDQLMDKLRELRGTPEEILENNELLELFLPVLRADFAIAETHLFMRNPPLTSDLTLIGGLDDSDISQADLLAWGEIFRGHVDIRMFEGGHFFITEHKTAVLAALKQRLELVVANLNGLAHGFA